MKEEYYINFEILFLFILIMKKNHLIKFLYFYIFYDFVMHFLQFKKNLKIVFVYLPFRIYPLGKQ
jgi:hypothetical protein